MEQEFKCKCGLTLPLWATKRDDGTMICQECKRIYPIVDPLQSAKDFRHQDFRKKLDKAEFWRGFLSGIYALTSILIIAFFLGILRELVN